MNKFGWFVFGIVTLALIWLVGQKIDERAFRPSFYGRGTIVEFDTNAAKEFIVYGKDVQVTVMGTEEVLFNDVSIPPVWENNPIRSKTFNFAGGNRDGSPTRLNFRWAVLGGFSNAGAYFKFTAPDGADVLGIPLGGTVMGEVASLVFLGFVGWGCALWIFTAVFKEKEPTAQAPQATATT